MKAQIELITVRLFEKGKWQVKGFGRLSLIAAIAASGAVAACSRSSSVQPSVACAEAGTGGKVRRILVVGESWAAGGRLFPELPAAVASRSGERVRSCSFGYPGQNSAKVLERFNPRFATRVLGGDPDNVVLLLGVNDQIQHRGASFFATNTAALADEYQNSIVQAVSAPIVSSSPGLRLPFRIKNSISGWFNNDNNVQYRELLISRLGSNRVISFTDYSPGFYKAQREFAPDGIHLTQEAFHAYGAFIGEHLNLKKVSKSTK